MVIGVSYHSDPTTLNQPTRAEIYSYIQDNPGVHFRGICEGLGMSVGVVQYHLDVLMHAGLIVGFSDGNNKRYFEAGTYTQGETELISLARHECTRQILTILSQADAVVHRDLACSLTITSQALSWQMNQLKDAALVSAQKVGVNVRYSLNDADAVRQVLALTDNPRSV
jgi:predicted transcriptional regulator